MSTGYALATLIATLFAIRWIVEYPEELRRALLFRERDVWGRLLSVAGWAYLGALLVAYGHVLLDLRSML